MEKEGTHIINIDIKRDNLLPKYTTGDLKFLLREFSQTQKHYIEIEREEEERQALDNIFNYSARELEKKGVCIRKLDLIESIYESFGQYLIHFQKRTTSDFKNKLARYKFGNGDIVGLFEFSEKVHADPLYKGVIYEFNEKKIVVAFEEDIEADKLPKNICLVQLCNQITYDRIKDTLEKLENFEIKQNCYNVIQVLFGIRDPTFNLEEKDLEKFIFYNTNLNASQKEAVKFCLDANELALIHGPPGTGKTTTVVELILQSINLGLKILVVAPSNIAVDNIAEKLLPFRSRINFEICRIGHPARIMESIVDISLDAIVEKSPNLKFVKDVKREIKKVEKELLKTDWRDKEKKKNLKKQLYTLRDDIKGSYKNTVIDIHSKSNVTLATCVGAADFYLNESLKRSSQDVFDLVVIDECAQSTEASCWVSILNAKKVVLAGDHMQLPPTIKSNEALKELGFTLFDRMIKLYGSKCAKLLDTQYRMNEVIMKFSSDELYEGKLKADESVKFHKLSDLISDKEIIQQFDDLDIVNENLILIDTNGFQFYECVDTDSGSKYNIGEAKVAKFFVDYLIKINIANSSLGIITPYSAQVNLLREHISFDDYKDLEISTVDGFQGREKEVIILSLVRSNKKNEVGFLADNRRLNVAITRAKRMIVLICDVKTVMNDQFLKKMSEYFVKNSKHISLAQNIFEYKDIEDIQYESVSKNKEVQEISNQRVNSNKESKENPEGKKKIKKNKRKGLDSNFHRDDTMNNKLEINHSISTQKILAENNFNQNFVEGNSYKKDEVSKEFISKIQSMINQFLNTKEVEYKIEGLSSGERKYIHNYADIKNLNHESKGDSTNRIMILRKKNLIDNKPKEKCEIPKEEISVESSNSTNYPKITEKSKISISIPTSQKKETKMFNPKAKATENWDEIDNIISEINKQDKEKCSYENCPTTSSSKFSMCNYCKKNYCDLHLRGIIHDCEILHTDQSHSNAFIKSKVNQKIEELEKKRNKKPKAKKK